jgi:hypothetical protein
MLSYLTTDVKAVLAQAYYACRTRAARIDPLAAISDA